MLTILLEFQVQPYAKNRLVKSYIISGQKKAIHNYYHIKDLIAYMSLHALSKANALFENLPT